MTSRSSWMTSKSGWMTARMLWTELRRPPHFWRCWIGETLFASKMLGSACLRNGWEAWVLPQTSTSGTKRSRHRTGQQNRKTCSWKQGGQEPRVRAGRKEAKEQVVRGVQSYTKVRVRCINYINDCYNGKGLPLGVCTRGLVTKRDGQHHGKVVRMIRREWWSRWT